MRSRRRNCHARVAVQPGDAPIVIGFGIVTFEATVDEARDLALAIVNAIEAAERGNE
jgi:hypothetical protein